MSDFVATGTKLGGTLAETFEQLAEDNTLVDVILRSSSGSQEDEDVVYSDTHCVRIILVGEDHIVLGPKRPIFNVFVPLEEILMVRISDKQRRDDEDEIDDAIEQSCFGWQREWDISEDGNSLTPDGVIHAVTLDDFDDAIADTPVVLVSVNDNSSEYSKILAILQRLAHEFKSEVLFVEIPPQEEIMEELGIIDTPAVVVLSDDEIISQIIGLTKTSEYRSDIKDAIDSIDDDCEEVED